MNRLRIATVILTVIGAAMAYQFISESLDRALENLGHGVS